PQVQLDYNRIAPLYTDYQRAAGIDFDYREVLPPFPYGQPDLDLDNVRAEALNLLNVRYIITHTTTELEGYPLVYEDRAVHIYENPLSMPRVYLGLNNVHIDEIRRPSAFDSAYDFADITSDTGRELLIDVTLSQSSAALVVSESFSSGWRAYIRPQGSDQQDERPLDLFLMNQNFIGARLSEAGDWTVRLVYSPTSFQVGLFASFISFVLVLLLLGIWLWRLMIAPPDKDANQASIVARNSVAPILLNLFNRGIDFAFAAVMLRVLGPADSGDYQYAIVIFVWFDILTNFGLNLFLTREVARNRERAAHLFWNTSALRLVLAVVGVIPLVLFISARQNLIDPPLRPEALLAIGLLYVGLLPNSLSTGLTALFYGFERAEVPAVVATIATLCKAVFGLVVLLAGIGFVGLAGVSILTNIITLSVLFYLGRGMLKSVGAPREVPLQQASIQQGRVLDMPLLRGMAGQSWPLMLNHFLATIFFQIDIVIIEAMHGNLMVGQYGVAYKWLSALNVIPSFFTQALLPLMSRQAHEDRDALKRNYTLAIKLLVSIALPLAALFTFLAYPLTTLLGGAEYLPDGAIALQLMIWSIPIGWINSLTQYVLIALDLQRRITRAFALAVGFNLIANLIFVPQYGYKAAAIITILSEAALLVPFALLLRGAFGPIIWLDILWRPVLATTAMILMLVLGWSMQPLLALVVALVVYPAALLALRLFTAEETARLMPLLPPRMARQLQVFSR
ncbi:MAG: flippase, partial [Burkholderiales bacterium]|nr:flippase [Anaerolineae bacterium]